MLKAKFGTYVNGEFTDVNEMLEAFEIYCSFLIKVDYNIAYP